MIRMKNTLKKLKGKAADHFLSMDLRGALYTICLIMLTASLFAVTSLSIQRALDTKDPVGNEYDSIYVVDVETEEVTDIPYVEDAYERLPAGGILAMQKKYDYEGRNVMILDVTNRTSNDYTVIIKAHFKDADGKVLKNNTRVFEGFPAGYQNYFVFDPGISFDSFSFELMGVEATEEVYAKYFKPGDVGIARTCWGHVYTDGSYIIPIGPEQVNTFPREVMIDCLVSGNILYPYEKRLTVVGDIVLFDKYGEIYYIGDGRETVRVGEDDELLQFAVSAFPPVTTGIPVTVELNGADINRWPLPENLSSVTGIYAVKEVYPTDDRETKFPRLGRDYIDP